jgi:hypothetical protein
LKDRSIEYVHTTLRKSLKVAVVDRGIPLAGEHSAANVHDSKMLEKVVDAIRPIRGLRGRPGRPRKRPEKLHAYPTLLHTGQHLLKDPQPDQVSPEPQHRPDDHGH